jgi:hypothetical protein
MSLLAGVAYDPSTAASADASALLAMTALDTTNLRLVFNAPDNGIVLVRLKGTDHGSLDTISPRYFLGVLDGATVRGRTFPDGQREAGTHNAMKRSGLDAAFLVTGLTPGNSYTWDAAYGVEEGQNAGSALKWGGPDNATGDDAFGAFCFEVWETKNLLAGVHYDPTTLVLKTTSALLAMTAIDTTNLRLTFVAPASGNVLWRIRTNTGNQNDHGSILLGILDGSTVKARQSGLHSQHRTNQQSSPDICEVSGVITGLTPGQSYTWDAAYGVEEIATAGATGPNYGGPNDATVNNAYGGIAYEIWTA